jgi:hypothetical protein
MIGRPGFSEWIEGSAFVNPDGSPLVFYHGTDTGSYFNIFARTEDSSIGFHFGDLDAAHCRVANITSGDAWNYGAIIPVVCNASKPLRLTDHFVWDVADILVELHDLGVVDDIQHDLILDSCSEYAVFAAIELAGYDCVIYSNETEHGGRPTDSLLIWRAEQVKGVYASRFDRGCPGLVPGIEHDPDDLECWTSVREELDHFKELLGTADMRPSGRVIPVF